MIYGLGTGVFTVKCNKIVKSGIWYSIIYLNVVKSGNSMFIWYYSTYNILIYFCADFNTIKSY